MNRKKPFNFDWFAACFGCNSRVWKKNQLILLRVTSKIHNRARDRERMRKSKRKLVSSRA